MNVQQENQEFHFSYSAGQSREIRQEVERIRSGYAEDGKDKLNRVRQLDNKTKQPALVFALLFGIGGLLLLGGGMSMVMVWKHMASGIAVGVAGCLLMAAAYPGHQYVLKKEKEKYKDEILRLCDELLQERDL